MARGNDPRKVFESVLVTGQTMGSTTRDRFSADVQRFQVTEQCTLFCFQVPCGGNIFLISITGEKVLIDTGYGIYHHDVWSMLSRYGLGDDQKVSRIIVTHANADHCGAAGYFTAPVFMHEGTLAPIKKNNRAYGSRSEHCP